MVFVLFIGGVHMCEKTCCFTGHRDLPEGERGKTADKLEQTIIGLIGKGICFYCAGGAIGFDTIAAMTVLKLKKTYPHIKLKLVLPCLTQTRGWAAADIATYEAIKAQANEVVYTSQEYTRGCMFKRNRHLVDNSSVCICYLTKKGGGTAYTVDYAKKQGLEVVNVAF